MKKINEKILELLDNGYGLIQMMEDPEVKINKEELIALMKDDEKLNKKLRKRFGDKFFEAEEPEQEEPSISEIDALKAEADALGIQYSAMIGVDKLRARIEEFKAKQQ
mgnify:FL=1